MTGKDKLAATAAKLKTETEEAKQEEQTAMTEAKNSLAALTQDPELAKMFRDNAKVGAENLSGEMPLLKIYTANKTKNADLADGKRPTDGFFYYKPKQKEFENPTVHILTISKGFRAEGMVNPKTGQKDAPKFNQLMAGLILDEGELLPFVMYFTGLKLQNLWDFGKEARQYTHGKVGLPIPMFALTVKLKAESTESNYGPVWVVDFEIVKDATDMPVVVSDPALFMQLRQSVVRAEDMIASIIDAKRAEDDMEKVERLEDVSTPTSEPKTEPADEVRQDDIPF